MENWSVKVTYKPINVEEADPKDPRVKLAIALGESTVEISIVNVVEEDEEAAEVESKDDKIEKEVEEFEKYLDIVESVITTDRVCIGSRRGYADGILVRLMCLAPKLHYKDFEKYLRRVNKILDDLETLPEQYLEGGLNDVKN